MSRAAPVVAGAMLGAALVLLPHHAPLAQTPGTTPSDGAQPKEKRVLTPEEKAEKAQRRVCKIQICGIFSSKDTQGANIDCPVVKTWREADIEEILSGGKLDWPWGRARCTTQLKLKRAMLAAAASEEGITAKLDRHTISCSLDLKSGGASYEVKVDMTPEVTFRGGKATAAQINWGAIDAPLLAYGVIWPGAKLDNSFNVLGGQVVKMTNEFMGRKCAALKDGTAAPSTSR